MNRADLSGGDLVRFGQMRIDFGGFFFRGGVGLCWNQDSICCRCAWGRAGTLVCGPTVVFEVDLASAAQPLV